MRSFLFMLALLLSVQGAQTASVESALPGAVPEQDAALEQWVAALEPVREFTVTEDYPEVILELFDLLIEEENDGAPDRRLSRADLRSLAVYGTREEFFRELELLANKPMLIRDWHPTLTSVAFPVFDWSGQFIAALGCYVPAYRFEGEHRENVLAGLYGITRVIQETLPAEGGFPPENQEFSARGQKYFV